MDDLEIIETVVDMRDSAEENVYFSMLIEGIIAFFILMLSIIFIYFEQVFVGTLILFGCMLLYGVIMLERIVQYRLLKKIKNKLEEFKNEKEDWEKTRKLE